MLVLQHLAESGFFPPVSVRRISTPRVPVALLETDNSSGLQRADLSWLGILFGHCFVILRETKRERVTSGRGWILRSSPYCSSIHRIRRDAMRRNVAAMLFAVARVRMMPWGGSIELRLIDEFRTWRPLRIGSIEEIAVRSSRRQENREGWIEIDWKTWKWSC